MRELFSFSTRTALEEKYIVNILNEIIYSGKQVTWDDIGGCRGRG